MKNVEFWAYAPVTKSSTQRCIKVDISYPYKSTSFSNNNQVLQFSINRLPPYATQIIQVKADIEMRVNSGRLNIDPDKFLSPEKYIESNHPDIRKLSEKFKANSKLKTAENVFHWVSKNIEYVYSKYEHGALYALKNKRGDCTESMYLFVALCRASGIPARCIGGYKTNGRMQLTPAMYHNWAEFYTDDSWHLSDPQNKVFNTVTDTARYIAMHYIENAENDPLLGRKLYDIPDDGVIIKMISD